MSPIEFALQELVAGVAEVPGPADNPRIGEYHKAAGIGPDDETSWCSSFVNWCHKQAGGEGTGNPAARSWIHWGKVTTQPKPGDVVVFWRGTRDGWQGHVAFYLGETGSAIIVLGGNQGDRVSVAAYSRERLLSYRRTA
jgi:uncharacterized protein (TIGR02594 family)